MPQHGWTPVTDAGKVLGAGFGRGQIIWRDPVTGVLNGGTEPRTDGQIACWQVNAVLFPLKAVHREKPLLLR